MSKERSLDHRPDIPRAFGLRQAASSLVPFALVVALAASCTPKTKGPVGPAPAASGSASSGEGKYVDEGPEEEEAGGAPLRGLHDQLPKKKQGEEPAKRPPRVGLKGGLEAIDDADYATAQRELEKASKNAKEKGAALVGLARVALETGKYSDATKLADEASRVDKASKIAAAPIKAKALASEGHLDEALKAVDAVSKEPEARRARLEMGALLLRMGRSRDAQDPLMTLIDDFNQKRITPSDAEGMALVGRAAHLLRSKQDANDSYNDAERAGNKTPELLLWRADLFLEAYNLGRAEEVVREVLKRAPDLAAAHMKMAEVKLAQTLDFDAAEEEVKKALATNPRMPQASFVRAGIALRDMELQAADKALSEGLGIDPKDLDLLSMKATVRFLADDKPGFQAATQEVLKLNPEYARMYQIIGEYADWEHRYAEIVQMMKEATKIDPDDGRSFVSLGINEIRLGDDKAGVRDLEAGFGKDKFNVRAFNTLNLYERDIPAQYDDVDVSPIFHVRYPKSEEKVLERYVPGFLDAAWKDMTKRYGFTPTTPVGVELYASREQFSVRTSGLPNIGIQGVCFGKTLAAISPKAEPFNWGMVVWHEVGHVFAIQLSKAHVPRWFTEGLSEYETIARRPEWRREEDPALWAALRRGKIPPIEEMNRVFTHADDARDITTAYYASSQISVFLVEKFGMPKLVAMLRAWGDGKRTGDVIRTALGIEPAELDRQFRAWLEGKLARYAKQYVPDLRAAPPDVAAKRLKENPQSAKAHVEMAIEKLVEGDADAAEAELGEAQKLEPKNPDVRFVRAKIDLGRRRPKDSKKELEAMIAEGNDGYSVRMMLADVLEGLGEKDKVREQLEAANRLDPTQAEPLQALVDMAHKAKDDDKELQYLRPLAMIDQHDHRVWRRLLQKLVARGQWDEAKKVGEGALYVDVHGAETHALYAEALLQTGDADKAIFEGESALLCEPLKANTAARANVTIAKAWLKKGDRAKAKAAKDEALRQDPTSKEAQDLAIPLGFDSMSSDTTRARPLQWFVRGGTLTAPGKEPVSIGVDAVTVGRDASATVVLDDPEVSALHAELVAGSSGVVVRDLGSKNGTFVGVVRIDEASLTGACTLRVGQTDLVFSPATGKSRVDVGYDESFGPLVGSSPRMRRLYQALRVVAPTELSVLVLGETGTGKELVAQAIHEASARKNGPFVVVDCGAIPAGLAESLLFGHEKGSFTGAIARRVGAFAEANGGTLFLDELGELPEEVQPKLLRAIAERSVKRVGASQYEPIDVRVVAATRRDLRREMNAGRFRSDLFFRLAQVRVELPRLADRREDIPALVRRACERVGRGERTEAVSSEIERRFGGYDWPGNVRELVNVASVLAALGDAPLETLDLVLPLEGRAIDAAGSAPAATAFSEAKRAAILTFERQYFVELLRATGGNVSEMARRSGMERHHVRGFLKKLGLSTDPSAV